MSETYVDKDECLIIVTGNYLGTFIEAQRYHTKEGERYLLVKFEANDFLGTSYGMKEVKFSLAGDDKLLLKFIDGMEAIGLTVKEMNTKCKGRQFIYLMQHSINPEKCNSEIVDFDYFYDED